MHARRTLIHYALRNITGTQARIPVEMIVTTVMTRGNHAALATDVYDGRHDTRWETRERASFQ